MGNYTWIGGTYWMAPDCDDGLDKSDLVNNQFGRIMSRKKHATDNMAEKKDNSAVVFTLTTMGN